MWWTSHVPGINGDLESDWMSSAVLPEAIFSPQISIIGTNQSPSGWKALMRRSKQPINPLQTGSLTTTVTPNTK